MAIQLVISPAVTSDVNVEVTPVARQTINIDRGLIGPAGPPGPTTITTGTTTTGAAGSSAFVANSGTLTNAVFDFTIPRGDTGAVGPSGTNGTNGVGVPVGGLTNQVLKKTSGTDYDTSWATVTGTGNVVYSTSPTLVTPILGTPTSGNFSTGTFTWPTFNQNTTGSAASLSATLAAASGGTGQSSYAVGDLLYADTTTSLATLSDVAIGNALISGGVGANPSWGKIGLTTHVSGELPIANGGTGATTLAGASIPTYTSTVTLTNKRITARVNPQTTTTSPWVWNSDAYDQQEFTALANALTINADLGTPTDGQKTVLRFQDNNTGRVLTFTGTTAKGFRPIGVSMTVSGSNFTYTTVANKTVYFGCIYNSGDSRWDVVAIAQEA